MTDAEIIDIGELKSGETITLNTEPISSESTTPSRSANFGPGAELLMNEKKKEGGNTPTSDINLADLNNLENEYLIEPFQISFEEKIIDKTFLFKLKELFIEYKGKNKVLLNIKKNGKDVRKLELKSRFVDAGNEELLHKVMDAIEYATIVLDENTSYGDEAPF